MLPATRDVCLSLEWERRWEVRRQLLGETLAKSRSLRDTEATRGPGATRQSAEHPDRSAASHQTSQTQTGILVRAGNTKAL